MSRTVLALGFAFVSTACTIGSGTEVCDDDVVDGIAVDPRTCRPAVLFNDDCRGDDDCDDGAVCYGVDAACFDDDDATICDRIGRCHDPVDARYCLTDDECGAGTCRLDDRFCLVDRRVDGHDGCVGFCVEACFLATTDAVDPATGICWRIEDTCRPPGFLDPDADDDCADRAAN